jgi:hypothetical protein
VVFFCLFCFVFYIYISSPAAPTAEEARLLSQTATPALSLLSSPDVDQEVKAAAVALLSAAWACGNCTPGVIMGITARVGDELLGGVGVRGVNVGCSGQRAKAASLALMSAAGGNVGVPGSLAALVGANAAGAWTAESAREADAALKSGLSALLRQSDRTLRVGACTALAAYLELSPPGQGGEGTDVVLAQLARAVDASDIHLAAVALRAGAAAVRAAPAGAAASAGTSGELVERFYAFLLGATVGGARDAAVAFAGELSAAGVDVVARVWAMMGAAATAQQALPALADCLAAAAARAPGDAAARVQALVADHTSAASAGSAGSAPSLFALGALLRTRLAGAPAGLAEQLLGRLGRAAATGPSSSSTTTTTATPSSDAMDADKAAADGDAAVREAAGWCLGGLGVGSMETVLPVLRAASGTDAARVAVLHAVREIVGRSARAVGGDSPVHQHAPELLSLLLAPPPRDQREAALTAECLGRLAVRGPAVVFEGLRGPIARGAAGEADPLLATTLAAVKITLSGGRATSSAALSQQQAQTLPLVLGVMAHSDYVARRAAVVALTCACRFAPWLARDAAAEVTRSIGALAAEFVERSELIRTVNLGPFEHRVDDGAEGRRCAVECADAVMVALGATGVLEGEAGSELARALGVKATFDKDLDIRIAAHRTIERLCGGTGTGGGGAGGAGAVVGGGGGSSSSTSTNGGGGDVDMLAAAGGSSLGAAGDSAAASAAAMAIGLAPPLLRLLVSMAEVVAPNLKRSLLRPLRESAPEQERNKRDDLIRSACQALAALTLPVGRGADGPFGTLVTEVVANDDRMTAWFKAAGGQL